MLLGGIAILSAAAACLICGLTGAFGDLGWLLWLPVSFLGSYLVLAAMTKVTQLSFLQAFRQMSLPIGLLLGIIILKEPAHRPKIAGITLIVTGLVLIAFLG